ncbi:hypothetical protein RI367_005719 [Sorochytrium milnesiophthora]
MPQPGREVRSVCVFCGSRAGNSPEYEQVAIELGKALAGRNMMLVYGGGDSGLMGAVARSVHQAGGRVVGILPRPMQGHVNELFGETVWVDDMHTRKQMMNDKCDAFIALPGGYGTFEELLECTTWSQLNIHDKPIVALNIRGFYEPLRALVTTAHREGFVSEGNTKLIAFVDSAAEALSAIDSYAGRQEVFDMNWKKNALNEDAGDMGSQAI